MTWESGSLGIEDGGGEVGAKFEARFMKEVKHSRCFLSC